METYGDIIRNQRGKLNKKINWWPEYLYHYTDVNNAVSIIDKESIYGRNRACDENLMNSDNASAKVINLSNDNVKNFARLYMRPKTPTQYHNEGYKPPHIRDKEINANCPVPIFFILDTVNTLSMAGVKFIEKGLAGNCDNIDELKSGEENYKNLNFDKIFHDGSFPNGSDIKQYRHTEVVREEFIPLTKNILRGIACRSLAEKQTLLYLLKKNSINKYERYKPIIKYNPKIDLFYNNGIFIKDVKFENNEFLFKLNDSFGRYKSSNSNGKDVEVSINFEGLNEKFQVIDRKSLFSIIDYKETEILRCKPSINKDIKTILIKVLFDGFLMYKNLLQINDFELF